MSDAAPNANRMICVPGSDVPAPAMHPATYEPVNETEAAIIAAFRTVFDPEIPVNIYDLGLIYAIQLDANGFLQVQMTLTAPGCPVAGEMPGMVATAAETVAAVQNAKVELVWEPAWTKERMTEDARLALGFF